MIYYQANILETIHNDIDRLFAINESEVLYYTGVWTDDDYDSKERFAWNTNETEFTFINKPCPKLNIGQDIASEYIPFHEVFGVTLLYKLADRGIDSEKIISLFPQLYEFYCSDKKLTGINEEYMTLAETWRRKVERWVDKYEGRRE